MKFMFEVSVGPSTVPQPLPPSDTSTSDADPKFIFTLTTPLFESKSRAYVFENRIIQSHKEVASERRVNPRTCMQQSHIMHAQTTVKKKDKAGDVKNIPVYKLLVPIDRSKYPGARICASGGAGEN